jgi:signal transduction histidine kinase
VAATTRPEGVSNLVAAAPIGSTGLVSTGVVVSAVSEPIAVAPAGVTPAFAPLRPAYCLLVAPLAIALALAGLTVAVGDEPLAVELVRPFVVASWAVAGLALGVRRRHDRLAPIVLGGAVVGGAGTLAAAVLEHRTIDGFAATGWELTLRLAAALLPAIAMHLLFGLADGRLATTVRRRAVITGYVVATVVGVALMAERDRLVFWPVAGLWALALGFGLHASHVRYVKAGAVDRRRMQWVGWGMAVAAEGAIVTVALRVLTDWPANVGAVALALTALIPLALALGTLPTMVARVDRLLTRTVEIAGLTAVVVAIYVVLVIGLGRSPSDDERSLLLLSMAAAGLSALLYLPARRRLTERANRLVYGERVAPDELLRTFGQRLTRSIPMDELLLQLVESLRKAMALESAEVWTGQDGHFELTAGVPHRTAPAIVIGPTESAVVARAGVSGGTWLDIWVPSVVGPAGSAVMRLAPVAHAGELLGFIAVTRRHDGEPFSEAEHQVLVELARQIALALHNVQLDTALQASLGELQVRNEELQRSRARIVAAGDAERRKLERNLHDGAQQHLVALAVKLRLTRDAVEDDPADAIAMIDEIRGNLQDAIQELRALAHGIFPPLLMSGGLSEALPAAAARAALPTTVDTSGVGRYSSDVEAAAYFCVLEAMQNAGKHAGNGAAVRVKVAERDGTLTFSVADDGAGFEVAGTAATGHGFLNMADRLGAFGGTIAVRSASGEGTTITGTLPLPG